MMLIVCEQVTNFSYQWAQDDCIVHNIPPFDTGLFLLLCRVNHKKAFGGTGCQVVNRTPLTGNWGLEGKPLVERCIALSHTSCLTLATDRWATKSAAWTFAENFELQSNERFQVCSDQISVIKSARFATKRWSKTECSSLPTLGWWKGEPLYPRNMPMIFNKTKRALPYRTKNFERPMRTGLHLNQPMPGISTASTNLWLPMRAHEHTHISKRAAACSSPELARCGTQVE